ncbi:MAG: ABC transporter ATP-binding protein [SAR324 cluster bacterium]|nr:ABC transporter ATP-binding protein [SAR324 cluster bacterium]
MGDTLLEVEDLQVHFPTPDGVVKAVNGISYSLAKQEILAIVGESGSGKSVGVLSLLRLIPDRDCHLRGSVRFEGSDLLQLNDVEMRELRGNRIAMVFQDPMTSLNPVLRIGDQIQESIIEHQGISEKVAKNRAIELLELVGIPEAEKRYRHYPHQFSGGMRQRIMIAAGLACEPSILIADEPTTALDVTIQAQIIDLVKKLRREIGMSVIWITHDLGIVAGLADRVAVMYAGKIVEFAPVDELFKNPQHPYSKGLLNSLPRLDTRSEEPLEAIEGFPPNLIDYPTTCPFLERCSSRTEQCQMPPGQQVLTPSHQVWCHHAVKV